MHHAEPGIDWRAVLHARERPPAGPGWNRGELDGLLPEDQAWRDAAVLLPLRPAADGWRVLLTLRGAGLRHHGGQVSFPGGRIEPADADAAAAALREAGEEIGLAPRQAEVLGYLDPLATISGFRVLPVVARIAPDFVPAPDPGEVAEVFEVALAPLLDAGNLRRVEIRFGGASRSVLEYAEGVGGPHRIWGATAMILQNLQQRIGGAR